MNVPPSILEHSAWARLEDQLKWYDAKSNWNQRWYKGLKITQVGLASSIPVIGLANIDFARWWMSVSGALIVVLEALQQLNQYPMLWITYRATAERLKHEKHLFLSAAGPYRNLPEPDRLIELAERVEEHVSTEHANWFNEARKVLPTVRTEAK